MQSRKQFLCKVYLLHCDVYIRVGDDKRVVETYVFFRVSTGYTYTLEIETVYFFET
jgi:hypothetical protein